MSSSSERDRRLLFAIDYLGPWERLGALFLGVRKDNTLRWEIPMNPTGWRRLLDVASGFCDRRDVAWRGRHAARGTRPWPIWRRRHHG